MSHVFTPPIAETPGARARFGEAWDVAAFRDHFLDKYFGYRRNYVAAVAALAPNRRSLAVTSEVARLAFVIAGSGLCALVFWALVVGSAERGGPFWPLVFVAFALVPTIFAALAVRGVIAALADREPAR